MSAFPAERVEPDAPVERSIFGTADPAAIWESVRELCPDDVDWFAFEAGVGALFGLRLADGARVALEVDPSRTSGRYLEAMQAVQAHLREQGFPCPQPLGVPGPATPEEGATRERTSTRTIRPRGEPSPPASRT